MNKEEKIVDRVSMIDQWKTSGDIYTQDELNAIGELLDLYYKEKEKNKTLETLLQGNLYQMYSYYKELASKYQANSISKDKIREKMEEVKELSTAGYEILKQLLEE